MDKTGKWLTLFHALSSLLLGDFVTVWTQQNTYVDQDGQDSPGEGCSAQSRDLQMDVVAMPVIPSWGKLKQETQAARVSEFRAILAYTKTPFKRAT